MLESTVDALIAERIPEWSGASRERIGQGHSPNSFLLRRAGRTAVLKIDETPRADYLATRIQEAMIQRQASMEGLAPDILYVDGQCILTDYAPARVPDASDFAQRSFLERLGRLLRRVHSLPRFGIRFDGPRAARAYAVGADNPKLAEHCIRCIDALPAAGDDVLSHNDVVAGNVLDDGRLQLVDWEFAADNAPAFDLAMIIAYHELGEEQADTLLAAYRGDAQLADRLPQYVRACHALNWLWLASVRPDEASQPAIEQRLIDRLRSS